MANVRPAAVAGAFYPGEPRELLADIDEMLGGVPGAPVSDMLDDDLLEEVWE